MKITDFKIGDNVTDLILYCTTKTEGISSSDNRYLSITLRDSSGSINGKIWEINDNIADFTVKSFVKVNGQIVSYKDSPQLKITTLSVVDSSNVDMDDFCPKTPQDIDTMLKELITIIDSIKNIYLNKLLHCFFDNPKFIEKFKVNSAAKAVHHAYIGGLLEHTICVTKTCEVLDTNYPAINRDLLLTAAICHDLGKLKELSAFPDNDYTDEGNLLGHIYMGTEMIDIQARKIEGFPRILLNELKHCILAHHGKMEFGSPKVPALIEAVALSFADDMDAKLRRFSDTLATAEFDTWSDKSDFFLDTKIRKTTI